MQTIDEIKTLPNVCATEMKKMKVWIKRETKKLVWVKMFSFVASQTKTDTLVWSLGALVSEEETKSKLRPYRITQPCPLHVTISRFYSQGSQSVMHNRGRAKVFRTNCLTA